MSRRTMQLVALCAVMPLAGAALAGGPPNDDCASAIVIPGDTITYSAVQSTVGATNGPCEGIEQCEAGGAGASASVWYHYTPAQDGIISINTKGSSYNTVLSVFAGCGFFNHVTFQCVFPQQLACDDDSLGTASQVMLPVKAGQPYAIKIAQYGPGGAGGTLHFNFKSLPPNDSCANPILINAHSFNPPLLSTHNATVEPCDAQESCENPNQGVSNSVWYLFVSLNDGVLALNTNGSTYDTILSVWDGCGVGMGSGGGPPCTMPVQLACDDDSGPGTTSQLLIAVAAGTMYLIKVADFNTTPGGGYLDFNATFSESCPADANHDGVIDVNDLLITIGAWGVCP